MQLNNVYLNYKHSPSFLGDSNILYNLSKSGMANRKDLLLHDHYLKRVDIDENIFIEQLLTDLLSKSNENKESSKNYLITGPSGSGKTTFMLRIANKLNKIKIKTFVMQDHFNVGFISKDPQVQKIRNYLRKNDNSKPAVIFVDEVFFRPELFLDLRKLTQKNPNIKIVCTGINLLTPENKDLMDYFPKTNILELKPEQRDIHEMLNSALQTAGFEKAPDKIANQMKKIDTTKTTLRFILEYLSALLSSDNNRIEDAKTLEAIPEKIWGKIEEIL